jgi:hypothetical protein
MIDASFDHNFNLLLQLKAARRQIAAFQSGDMFRRMSDSHEKQLRLHKRLIEKLRRELAEARLETIRVRNLWWEALIDAQKDFEKRLSFLRKQKKIEENQKWAALRERDRALEAAKEWRRKFYEAASELEEEKGKNLKLQAQVNRDYENSSIPSSKSENHKKIPNSREHTGRKPGAQPGHPGHGRQKQAPTQPRIILPPPEQAVQDPGFKKTRRSIIKQMVGIRLMLDVQEYQADIYYNSKTGERVHAAFPEGVVNDVNYDGSIKAFLFLLNNECCVSIDKCRQFLSELTGGRLNISKGMVNSLSRTFAEKSKPELRKVFNDMLLSPVMHVDCTNARVNGDSNYVFVCTTPQGQTLYFGRQKKGHTGVAGTVAEDYQGILVHDHESTFYHYGSDHQECLAHVLRYLKDGMDNEPERPWNREMRELIQEMIHYRNRLPEGEKPDPEKVAGYESRYDRILEAAMEGYRDIPPSPYYRDGYNLAKRMQEKKKNHLLFLHNTLVPTTNNAAERALRKYKRKQVQAVSFRGDETIENLCECMSMLALMRQEDGSNVFSRVSEAFG